MVLVWIAGCIRDMVAFNLFGAHWKQLAFATAFTLVGVALIIGVAWIIGRAVRAVLGVPAGQDLRSS